MDLKTKNRLLKVRETQKDTRPSFARVESWRYPKLKKSGWRKQRGIDNKTRRKTKNGVKSPEPGYRGPRAVRGMHPSGLEDIVIINKNEIEKLNLSPKKHGIRISTRLGARKKIELVEYLRDRGFKILNIGISRRELEELEELAIDDEDLDSDEEEENDSKEDDSDEKAEEDN